MTFRNGERVIYVGTKYAKLIGKTGTVVGTAWSSQIVGSYEITQVDWDDVIEGGWSCNGLAREGHGWNVVTRDLRPEFDKADDVQITNLNLEEVL